MSIAGQIRRQLVGVKTFRAYGTKDLLRQIYTFPRDFLRRGGWADRPLGIAFLPTLRCPARCRMCNVRSLLNQHEQEMDLETIERFLCDLVPAWRPGFVISGGEPFARPDLVEIVRMIKEKGLPCGIFTSGLGLTEKKIEEVVGTGLDFLAFSLLGPEKVHDGIVGIKGAHQKLIGHLEILSGHRGRTRVILQPTISMDNVDHLEDIVKIGHTYRVDAVRFGHLSFLRPEEKTENGPCWKERFGDPPPPLSVHVWEPGERADKIRRAVEGIKSRYPDVHFTPELRAKEVQRWYGPDFPRSRPCLFVWRSLFLLPDGTVWPCESLCYEMGNIRQKSLRLIWNQPRYRKLRLELKKGLLPACCRCCKL